MPEIANLASDFHPVSIDPVTPEKRLVAAILERLIMDLICSYKNSKLRLDALEFLDDTPLYTSYYPQFSYPWLCLQLDLDPVSLRTKILGINYIPSKNRKSSYRSMIY